MGQGTWKLDPIATADLPTSFGLFRASGFRMRDGFTYVALVKGDLTETDAPLTRVHSECLTGDALGSLRCDCGLQLKAALRAITAEGRGVVIYATGHEGRGIGLLNKLRAYVEQDRGMDTVDANLHLGLPVDARDFGGAALVLKSLGVKRVRLLTNNPAKVTQLQANGIVVDEVRNLPVAPHLRSRRYLEAKERKLGHAMPPGPAPAGPEDIGLDVARLVGPMPAPAGRPFVLLKYAQSLDGRIATAGGDASWISGNAERRLCHALRASCDAVMVGAGTVRHDDPRLTVRMVEGVSPLRVVLDSRLRVHEEARVLDDDAPTVVFTTARADPATAERLRRRDIDVRLVPASEDGVDLPSVLRCLAARGVQTLMVEGGAGVITSLLRAGLVDRLVATVAPIVLGRGIEGVGDLHVAAVSQAIRLRNTSVTLVGDDVLIAGDLCPRWGSNNGASAVGDRYLSGT
jgi:3,4-dihydroxy 2-butanone 4-phosphate synthase/GTP cyclohydrolase II